MRALGDFLIEKALVLTSEDERHGTLFGQREDVRGTIARRLHVLTVKAFARGRTDDGHAVSHGLLERREFLAVRQDVRRMHRQTLALFPGVLEIRGRQTEMMDAHVGHRTTARTDVAGVEGAHEHHADIVKRIHQSPPSTAAGEIVPSKTSRYSRSSGNQR